MVHAFSRSSRESIEAALLAAKVSAAVITTSCTVRCESMCPPRRVAAVRYSSSGVCITVTRTAQSADESGSEKRRGRVHSAGPQRRAAPRAAVGAAVNRLSALTVHSDSTHHTRGTLESDAMALSHCDKVFSLRSAALPGVHAKRWGVEEEGSALTRLEAQRSD